MNLIALTEELKRLEALVALAIARAVAAGKAAVTFAKRQQTTAITTYGSGTGAPVPVAFAGTPTATTVQGSRNVTMSAPITANVGDLVLFGTPGPNHGLEGYEVAAPAPVASTALVLTAPYSQVGAGGVTTQTVPVADSTMVLAPITGLPATGWRINVSGQLDTTNTNAADRQIAIYVSGSSLYGEGAAQFQDLPNQNDVTNVPFNVDLVAGSPSATSYTGRIFVVALSGAAGDVQFGLGTMQLIATQVG